jgi:isoquinoline 1-oxidoreductase alpha subunit
MGKYNLTINQKQHTVNCDADMPLLWVLREKLGLTGTKFGCGIAMCGACTIHLNGQPARSCQLPVSQIGKSAITTIEGIAPAKNKLHPVQEAWQALQVPQCGYCQSGQIMTAVAILKNNPKPKMEEISAGMSGNLCRCGTYDRINQAVKHASDLLTK